MNLVALITLLAGLLYVYLGYFGLKLDYRARLNQIFFLLCMACAWWAFCIAFMFPAADSDTAWLLLRFSSPGWCLGPPLILHFTIYLTCKNYSPTKRLLTLGIYIPGLVFTVIGMTQGLTSNALVQRSFGWDNLPAISSPEYWAYVVFYLLCVGISIIMVIRWGYRSNSHREKEQAKILAIFSFLGLILASGSETLLPMIGFTSYPKIPVVMWLFWAYGMWYAISRYRFLILTPEIATNAIVASITDMMIMLNSKGDIIIANQSVQSLLGYSQADLLNKPGSSILVNKKFFEDSLEQMNAGILSNCRVELDYQGKSGESFPVMLSCSAIRDSFNELAGIVMVAQDLRPTKLLELQNAELEAISNDLMETNLNLQNKSLQIKNIMDNVGQGFLTFGPNLIINDDYSQECNQIFAGSPTGQTLAHMLYPNNTEQSYFLNTIFSRLLNLEDEDRINLYMPLLPSEIELNYRFIKLEYRIVKQSDDAARYIICILTDISEKRLLEDKMEEERTCLSMVVKAIVYYDTFIECIEEYKSFCNHGIDRILNGSEALDHKISEIYRHFHTFKGNFSQFDTIQLVNRLHQIESLISQAWESEKFEDVSSIRKWLQEFNLLQWLDNDLRSISDFLGEGFWQKHATINIDKKNLLELEEKLSIVLSPREYNLLLPYIHKLRYKSFKEMLKPYPEYVLQMSERMGKIINPFIIEGDDQLVDTDYFHNFTRSLVHIFRNMVDHGIEYPDERLLQGKSEIGTISCRIELNKKSIKLYISDDGAGIDVDNIRTKAIASGTYLESELAGYSDEQIINLVFEEHLSTSENVSLISGRGLGLAVVKTATDEINGSVQINTELGKGTKYIFNLPLPKINEFPVFSTTNIIISIMETIQHLASSSLGLNLTRDVEVAAVDKISLNQYSALINIRGAVDGIIMVSYNEDMVRELARVLVYYDDIPLNDSDILEDLTAEATNIIVGNSLKKLGDYEDLVRIGIPTVTANLSVSIKQSYAQIYTCSIKNNKFMVTCSFIPV